jgi:predicted ATP-grasp superfamily ATP-dependent carboligase
VLPTSDHGLEFIARNRAFLESMGYLPTEANDELVLMLLDKYSTSRLAEVAGVEAPRASRVERVSDIEALDFVFPCVVKPTESHHPPAGFLGRKAIHVRDQQELEETLRVTVGGDGVVVAEVVPGADDAFCSYYTYLVDGDPLFHYTKHKLRQHPIHFGIGSYHVSGDVPDARELGLRLFRAAGLVGLGNVEFKRDARDGRLKLIECNLRLTAADPMIRHEGLDLPFLLYERAIGRPGLVVSGNRRRTRQWHPMLDVRAFMQYRRAGELTTLGWLRSLLSRKRLPFFLLADPVPSVMNTVLFLRRSPGYVNRWRLQRAQG